MKRLFTQPEVLIHLLFWLILIVFFSWNNAATLTTNHYGFILAKFITRFLPFMILVYINVLYLIPLFFQKRQYQYYFFAFLGLWIFGTPLATICFNQIETVFSFVAPPGYIQPFGLNAYLIVFFLFFITSSIRFIFRLIQQQNEYNHLQNLHLNMELDLLKNQINPHFFFNTLHNLNGLVLENSKNASKVIVKLSEMMRYSLYESGQDRVLLKREIEYLQNYLYLQKIRLHQSTDIQLDSIQISDTVKIPPLLLIIFVENAFKHGVDSLMEKAFVHITIKEDDKQLFFNIINNYDAEGKSKTTRGLGIQNAKKRLDLLFGQQYKLNISDAAGVFEVEINIPKT